MNFTCKHEVLSHAVDKKQTAIFHNQTVSLNNVCISVAALNVLFVFAAGRVRCDYIFQRFVFDLTDLIFWKNSFFKSDVLR